MSDKDKTQNVISLSETEEGFVRLMDFIKNEHIKKKLNRDPKIQALKNKIKQYKSKSTASLLKKGLQLNKAA